MTDETPNHSQGPDSPVDAVIRAFLPFHGHLLSISTAAQTHRDQMLTWAIGLMLGGIYPLHYLLTAACKNATPRDLIQPLSPWALALIFALLARITGARYSYTDHLLRSAEEYQTRLLLAKQPSPDEIRAFLDKLQTDSSLARYEQRRTRLDRITEGLSYLTHFAFAAGLIYASWKLASC